LPLSDARKISHYERMGLPRACDGGFRWQRTFLRIRWNVLERSEAAQSGTVALNICPICDRRCLTALKQRIDWQRRYQAKSRFLTAAQGQP